MKVLKILFVWLFFLSLCRIPSASGSATSGDAFEGNRIREFLHRLHFNESEDRLHFNESEEDPISFKCRKWCVVTTINPPTESILQHAALSPFWCMVVVGDLKSPENYELPGCSTCVYLNAKAQEEYLTLFPEFGKLLPWNHFGRKNLGYLYAIHHGAQEVWDFDDDNELLGKSIRIPQEEEEVVVPLLGDLNVLNPNVHFGSDVFPIWPRGFPLEQVKNEKTFKFPTFQKKVSSIAVLQSLANHDPDVDAIFRLTQPLPVTFQADNGGKILLLPNRAYSPINGQACLFRNDALWMLLLPVTVHGRVSDIWRGYIGQRLLRETGSHVGFAAPFVTQNRNPHSYLLDFDAELPLYQRSRVLIDLLEFWSSRAKSLPSQMEELAVQLFERGYFEMDDVLLTQEWLKALQKIGYSFPSLKPHNPWHHILVIVRFNFGHYESAERFLSLWQDVFPNIVFCGPESGGSYPDSVRSRLIITTDSSDGWYYYKTIPDIIEAHPNFRGYLVMHDDMYIRMETLNPEFDKFWIAKSDEGPVDANNRPGAWRWQQGFVNGCTAAVNDPFMESYHQRMQDQCGLPLPLVGGQSDLFFIPHQFVEEVSKLFRFFGDRDCMLETAVPTIFNCLLDQKHRKILNLVTDWSERRNTPAGIEYCMNIPEMQLCHPIKLHDDAMWNSINSYAK